MEDKETLEQKKRRIYGRQYLKYYLEELSNILTRNIDSKDLLSIIATDKIAQHKRGELINKHIISFSNKEKLRKILTEYVNSKNFYLFISHSLDCGTLEINLFTDFNFDFNFKDLSSQIITLLSIDFKEEIILDYYEEDNIEYLEVEIYKS